MMRVLPTTFEPALQQIRLQGFFLPYVGGKTRNIAIQLVLKLIRKTRCTFFVTCFTVP